LLLIIMIILGVGLGLGFGLKSNKKTSKNPNVPSSTEDKNKDKKQAPSSDLSKQPKDNDNYKKSAIQQSINGGPDGYSRNQLSGGRCDGLYWITDPNAKTECIKNIPPPVIKWKIDYNEYKDLKELPNSFMTNNKNKLLINIPYKLMDDKYYVDCDKMTYADGKQAKLFRQTNIINNQCQYIEKSATMFEDKKRLTDSKNLYTLCKK